LLKDEFLYIIILIFLPKTLTSNQEVASGENTSKNASLYPNGKLCLFYWDLNNIKMEA